MAETVRLTIDPLELLALKKLAIINGALAQKLTGQAAREQLALTSVLVDVLHRADIAQLSPKEGPDG